eukprot:s615_g20.t1
MVTDPESETAMQHAAKLEPGRAASSAPEVTPSYGEVHSADTQYALLGADPDASEMDLRQCFLRKAVEVHPATLRSSELSPDVESFCKVAAAWTELRDLGSRWRYDMDPERRFCRGRVSQDGTHRAPPMDLEKALGIFAFETWVCEKSVHQVAQDFAPVLELAHQLALDLGCLCRTTEHSVIESANFWGRVVWLRRDLCYRDVVPHDDLKQVTPTTVACGMAVSAGLLAAGCVASAAGYPALGSCVRKGALFQGASQAASGFSDDIQAACARVSQSASKIGASCTDDPLATLFGGMSCLPYERSRACLFQEAADASGSEDLPDSDEEDARVILPGDTVRVVALQGASGRLGQVLKAPTHSGGSFQVQLFPPPIRPDASVPTISSGRLVSVKKENLQLANESTCPRTCSENVPLSTTEFL